MRSHRVIQTARSHGALSCLALLASLSAWQLVALSSATAQQQEAVKTAPEPSPQQPPLNNWFNVSTPGVRALVRPGSLPEYEPPSGCICCPGQQKGHFCRRLLAWVTYYPKERVCVCLSCCNSCQYHGVLPLYSFFLNPKCYEGSGLRQTFQHECYRGCKDCANSAAVGPP
jgi:hypothetical protein